MKQDMLRMLVDPSFSDLLFLCGAAKTEVPALRMLVAARSPVLEKMLLRAGMAETKQTSISLPEIEPATMRICVEFLYTDDVQDSSWVSIQTCMAVFSAADFFQITKLAELAKHRLNWECRHRKSGSKSGEDLIKAYSYGVDLLHTHPHIGIDVPLKDLMQGIYFKERWHLDCHIHLSERGIAHLLQNLPFENAGPSMKEYGRFHYLIRWCFSRMLLWACNPHEEKQIIEKAMNGFFPSCLKDFETISRSASNFEDADADVKRVIKLLAVELSCILPRVPIDFSRIPAFLLCNVIEPLQVVPSSILLATYRLQASRKADITWDEFAHCDNYKIGEDDCSLITSHKGRFAGFARCSLFARFFSCVSFYWEIVMLVPCEKLRVGFCGGRPHIPQSLYNKYLVGDFIDSVALSSDGILHWRTTEKETQPYCPAFDVTEGMRIGVHISKGSCSFLINDNHVGECWRFQSDWTSDAKVYPAISMKAHGSAQIKLVAQG